MTYDGCLSSLLLPKVLLEELLRLWHRDLISLWRCDLKQYREEYVSGVLSVSVLEV